ncbi:putative drug exporter of the RND superfamily [Paraoerskovia marina]|uniref:Putative drug exporter of the RND superfamily n=1 Tax=Paraoerskovia marina TaxID=545619 RepID=A0A1H1MYA3_9CELL|nr:MMPL family transporter [Paraoerskovia marina]SDR91578.1 putative drug exporter of the RND superfamily [Paraoerskovia marina]
MAELLYRLGRFAAHHVRVVIAAWVAILAVAGVGYSVGAGTLSDSFSIPGTPTQEVTDQLAEVMPDLAGGTGTVVLTTSDDEPFTDEQIADLSEAFTEVTDVDGVEAVVDPFTTEAERDAQTAELEDGQQQIEDGRAQIEDGRAQIEAGQQQIDEARAELEAGQEQLDAAREQAEAAGLAEASAPQLNAQQEQIDAGLAELETQQAALDEQSAELEAGAEELEEQAAQAEDGAALLDLASGIQVVSDDGATAVATVSFTEDLLDVSQETKDGVIDTLTEEVGAIDGVEVDFGADIATETPQIVGPGEIAGLIVAAITLFVMLGTFIGAGLPLLTALIGVGIATLGALSFSSVVQMSSVTPVLGLMLGLAVGIDYALFIINRHRRQLKEGYAVDESVALANGTSGNAVVFAGSTVMIALLALNVTGIPFLGLMGTVAAGAVLIAVLVAITLTPALLSLVGMRILSRKERAVLEAEHPQAGAEGDHATSHIAPKREKPIKPIGTWAAVGRVLIGVAVLLVVAIPSLDLRINLPDGASAEPGTTSYESYQTISEEFGPGVNGPLLVVAELPEAISEDEAVATEVEIGETIAAVDDVEALAPVGLSDDGTVIAFQVIPTGGPTDESTEALVHELRGLSPLDDGTEIGVAGSASGNIDISEKLSDALPLYLGVVVGLSLIILILVFRSILVPLIATGGFVLSYYAALGGVVAIYQWGWLGGVFNVDNPGPVLNFLPTILVGVLFGLAMDYQLFLGSGMREAYAHGAPAKVAVAQGFRAGRSVVTAAAIIMISVFGGFIFAEDAMIRPIGFALAFGVLVDAFVVRMWIIPALMTLLGDAAWWLPKWLDKILPDVDVEGAALERKHPHVDPADGVSTGSTDTTPVEPVETDETK